MKGILLLFATSVVLVLSGCNTPSSEERTKKAEQKRLERVANTKIFCDRYSQLKPGMTPKDIELIGLKVGSEDPDYLCEEAGARTMVINWGTVRYTFRNCQLVEAHTTVAC